MSRIVSADEARKLLDAYHAPGSDRPLTLNNSADTAMFRAAPDLAATVVALSEDFDRQADEIMAAYRALRATPEQTVARRLSALCAEVVAERDEAVAHLATLAAAPNAYHPDPEINAERAQEAAEAHAFDAAAGIEPGWHKGNAASEISALRSERDRLHDILAAERGERAPEGWTSVWEPEDNNGDPPEYVAIWAYRKDTICAFVGLSEDSPTARWWSVHFGTAPSGRNQRPMERGEAENMLAAIEAAGLVIEADRTAKATASPSDG